jgi:hypothetical protein
MDMREATRVIIYRTIDFVAMLLVELRRLETVRAEDGLRAAARDAFRFGGGEQLRAEPLAAPLLAHPEEFYFHTAAPRPTGETGDDRFLLVVHREEQHAPVGNPRRSGVVLVDALVEEVTVAPRRIVRHRHAR